MKIEPNDSVVTESFLSGQGRMSHPEEKFLCEGYLLLADTLPEGVYIDAIMYEWISFNLPGGRYTPDFMIRLSDGNEIFVEVKQESVSKKGRVFRGQSYRDSRSKLRATASLNLWYKFYMAIYSRGGWKLEYIEPDPFVMPMSMKR